jgi:hypothetical protein
MTKFQHWRGSKHHDDHQGTSWYSVECYESRDSEEQRETQNLDLAARMEVVP